MKSLVLGLCGTMAATVAANGALATDTFPGQIDAALVGNWICGDTRLYITDIGSVERLDDRYRAGLYDAKSGVFAIRWNDGTQTEWRYEADGAAVRLSPPDGPSLECVRRG